MKKIIVFIITFVFLGIIIYAQNDTLYIMKNGVISAKYNVNTQIDSVIFYDPFPTRGTFTDSRDGNTYNWVKIGTQIWMAENLKYLPSVIGPSEASNTQEFYYVYDYNGTNTTQAKATSNYNTYGVLYNWPAAMAGASSSNNNPSGVQGACPVGWHLPSVLEWDNLHNFLADNGFNYDGSMGGGGLNIAKSLATSNYWMFSLNNGAVGNTDYSEYRNKSGFSALPGGIRNEGYFSSLLESGLWWSSNENSSLNAYHEHLVYLYPTIYTHISDKKFGFSVRCVKN